MTTLAEFLSKLFYYPIQDVYTITGENGNIDMEETEPLFYVKNIDGRDFLVIRDIIGLLPDIVLPIPKIMNLSTITNGKEFVGCRTVFGETFDVNDNDYIEIKDAEYVDKWYLNFSIYNQKTKQVEDIAIPYDDWLNALRVISMDNTINTYQFQSAECQIEQLIHTIEQIIATTPIEQPPPVGGHRPPETVL